MDVKINYAAIIELDTKTGKQRIVHHEINGVVMDGLKMEKWMKAWIRGQVKKIGVKFVFDNEVDYYNVDEEHLVYKKSQTVILEGVCKNPDASLIFTEKLEEEEEKEEVKEEEVKEEEVKEEEEELEEIRASLIEKGYRVRYNHTVGITDGAVGADTRQFRCIIAPSNYPYIDSVSIYKDTVKIYGCYGKEIYQPITGHGCTVYEAWADAARAVKMENSGAMDDFNLKEEEEELEEEGVLEELRVLLFQSTKYSLYYTHTLTVSDSGVSAPTQQFRCIVAPSDYPWIDSVVVHGKGEAAFYDRDGKEIRRPITAHASTPRQAWLRVARAVKMGKVKV